MDTRTELQRYTLHDVRETAIEIGRGSYATVVELDYKGLRCVGKKIHKILYEGQEDVHLRRFEEECRLLSQLSHPHIVQFLGIYFEDDTSVPVLVMEFLPMTLAQCLDKYGIMQNEISFSVLQDITLGLRYLHERDNPIIHRDLSANNVLLTSDMSAKISDLGVARIIQSVNSSQLQTMTKTPGTWCYMPPEAMAEKACYNLKVDTFSFGVMMIHVLSGCWPFLGEAVRTNPKNPNELIAVSEFDRRETTIRLISDTHPLIPLIKRCLSNSPSLRPTAFEIYEQVSVVAKDNPPSFANRTIMLEIIRNFRKESERNRIKIDTLKSSMDAMIAQKDAAMSENTLLTSELAEKNRKMSDLKSETEQLRTNVHEMEQEIDAKKNELLCKEAALVTRCDSLKLELDETSVIKGLDIFTPGIKFSSVQCATASRVRILVPRRVFSSKNGAYIEYCEFGSILVATGLLHYNCNTDTWQNLPFPPVKDYNLGCLFEKLLLVGGHKDADVYEFDETSQQWVKSTTIPPITTARSLATVATWTTQQVSALIVCGGKDHKLRTMAEVEIFHSATFQWHTAASLPLPRYGMMAAIVKNTLYLTGGLKMTPIAKCSFFSICIPDLLESSLQPKERSTSWQILPDIPSAYCLSASLNGHLLAVNSKAFVYIYFPLPSSWIKLGKLPFPEAKNLVEGIIALSMNAKELLVIEIRQVPAISTASMFLFSTPNTTNSYTTHFTANKVELTL